MGSQSLPQLCITASPSVTASSSSADCSPHKTYKTAARPRGTGRIPTPGYQTAPGLKPGRTDPQPPKPPCHGLCSEAPTVQRVLPDRGSHCHNCPRTAARHWLSTDYTGRAEASADHWSAPSTDPQTLTRGTQDFSRTKDNMFQFRLLDLLFDLCRSTTQNEKANPISLSVFKSLVSSFMRPSSLRNAALPREVLGFGTR